MALPLWLATINPGKTSRRRSGRRKLSKWQQEVRAAGGVMQAVKARRSRKHSRRRSRKNPFLTAAKMATGFAPNAARRRKRRKNATRRSAVSRRMSLRSRSRRAKARRPKMARVSRRRRRRTPPRGAGGRFKSRRSRRSRKHRRNPVVPVSWNPRKKRRRSRRRNPLFLTRKHRFSGRGGYKRLHMRRRHPRRWHNNPVVPVSWNPRKRRSSRRRGYRRNPVLPFFAMNPLGGAGNPLSAIMDRVKSMIDVSFWTETGIPATVGFFGSKAIGGYVYNMLPNVILTTIPSAAWPFVRATTDAVSGAALAWGAGKFVSKKAGDAIWLGTVVNVSFTLIQKLLQAYAPGVAATIGMSGLGDASDELKAAVTRRVQQSLSGYLKVDNMGGRNRSRALSGSYATVDSLAAKRSYDPSPRMNLRDYDVANDSTEL